jgi:hypothetical protein
MPNLKVTVYIRIVTPEGKRKMCKPVYASRGRLKPLHAADAKGNSLGHHPEGEYYLRYAGRTEAVGNDPYVALDRLEERKAEFDTTAWQRDILPFADAALLLDGRVRFYRPSGERGKSGTAPSVLLAYGQNNVEALRNAGIAGALYRKAEMLVGVKASQF